LNYAKEVVSATYCIPSLKLTWHLKITPGKGDSYWKPSFFGAMLVSGRVFFEWNLSKPNMTPSLKIQFVLQLEVLGGVSCGWTHMETKNKELSPTTHTKITMNQQKLSIVTT